MIKLTRLNGKTFYLNALLIETIESFPDTTVLLTNGKRYVVKEDVETLVNSTKRFYRDIQLITIDRQEEDLFE
ncbi:flagellar FlbD family protein [Bacillus andreraoultii]|uniref:flagellar FlbD family protein n=1 Tax=Bacillus andreraoultii TaxID=1499685 RepID=UPI000539EF1A|nr:flagellar FlbD family protein [Bacillus andreraoultii]